MDTSGASEPATLWGEPGPSPLSILCFLVTCVDEVLQDFDDVGGAVDSICEKCVGFDGSRHRLALGVPSGSVTIGTLGSFSVNRLTRNDQMQLETEPVYASLLPTR
jgi:hypothetical protein